LQKREMFTLLILMFEAHWIGKEGGHITQWSRIRWICF